MRTRLDPFALALAWLGACGGNGVSTTARTSGYTDAGSGTAGDGSDAQGTAVGSTSAAASEGTASAADSTTTSGGGSSDGGGDAIGLQGVWRSEGDDIAPILVELTHAVSITATFGPQAFTVVTVDDQGQRVQQVGVWVAMPSGVGEIMDITLEQTMPQAVTVQGIYEIDDGMTPAILRYEVVQTEPSVGATVPTAQAGFGGTPLGADLTQVFVRQ